MISAHQIKIYLASGKPVFEPTQLEFKKAEEIKGSFLETVSAFANTSGGDIVLGLAQNTKTAKLKYIGMQAAEAQEDKIKSLLQQELVNLSEDLYQISIESFDGQDLPLIIVSVQRIRTILERPAYIKSRGLVNGSFIRIGQGDKKMPPRTLERIQKEQMRFKGELPAIELTEVREARLSDLDQRLIDSYIGSLRKAHVPLATVSDANENFLKTKDILSSSNYPTYYGLICFGKTPERFLDYKCCLHLADERAISLETGGRGRNDTMVQGPLAYVFQEGIEWLQTNLDRVRTVGEDGQAYEAYVYPLQLLRELLANALVHRDYGSPAKVLIKLRKGEIEFENPGMLDDRIYARTVVMPGKTEHPNPKIARYAYDKKLAEGRGRGFSALLVACIEGKIDVPTIRVDFNGDFRIILRTGNLMSKDIENIFDVKRHRLKRQLGPYHKRILAYLIKSTMIAQAGDFVINLSEEYLDDSLKNALAELVEAELVVLEPGAGTRIYSAAPYFFENQFLSQLASIYKQHVYNLQPIDLNVLNIIYEYTLGSPNVSARKIAELLYPQADARSQDFQNNLYRRIKMRCAFLQKKGFIVVDPNTSNASPKRGYKLNELFSVRKMEQGKLF